MREGRHELGVQRHAITLPLVGPGGRCTVPRIASEMASGGSVELGSASATIRRISFLQLADAARPAVEEGGVRAFPRRRRGGPVELLGGAFDEVVDEAGDFVAPLAERADAEGDDAEAVKRSSRSVLADRVVESSSWWRR